LWNGANETTFHRRIKTPKKTQRRRPKLPASLTWQVFHRVVPAIPSRWAAVPRRPLTPEVALGLWLQTCPGLAQ
jgi:hypothetical protein